MLEFPKPRSLPLVPCLNLVLGEYRCVRMLLLLLIFTAAIAPMYAQLVIESSISQPQTQTYYVANLSATRGEDCGAYYSVTPMPQAPQGQPQTYYIANLSANDGADCGEYVSVSPVPQATYPTPTLPNLSSLVMPVQFSEPSSEMDHESPAEDPDPDPDP
jgi:hypothetical protein